MEALEEGIQTLEKQNQDVGQAEGDAPAPEGGGASAALAQIKNSKLVPTQAKRAIEAFLSVNSPDDADDAADLAIVAPEAGTALRDNAALLQQAAQANDFEKADKANNAAKQSLMQLSSSDVL